MNNQKVFAVNIARIFIFLLAYFHNDLKYYNFVNNLHIKKINSCKNIKRCEEILRDSKKICKFLQNHLQNFSLKNAFQNFCLKNAIQNCSLKKCISKLLSQQYSNYGYHDTFIFFTKNSKKNDTSSTFKQTKKVLRTLLECYNHYENILVIQLLKN